MPGGVHNRLADNWRPLFAIAEVIGGDWPERVRAATMAISAATQNDADSIPICLLADIRDLFEKYQEDKLFSEKMATSLHGMEDRPWPEYGRQGKPISKNQIAHLLKPFNIRPGTIRIGTETSKGYRLSQFAEAFARYLPSRNDTTSQAVEFQDSGAPAVVTRESSVTVEGLPGGNEINVSDAVTDQAGEEVGRGQDPRPGVNVIHLTPNSAKGDLDRSIDDYPELPAFLDRRKRFHGQEI